MGVVATLAATAQTAGALPLGLPPLPASPADDALIAAGKRLFEDTQLSRHLDRSCATCHQAARHLTDGRETAQGSRNRPLTRNTPSLDNVVYVSALFWDGRVTDLVDQAQFPLTSSLEHGLASDQDVIAQVRRDPGLTAALTSALHVSADALTGADVRRAIAAYERSLLAGNSPADRYLYGGDPSAMSASAIRGLELFKGRAGCANCHTIGVGSALYTDGQFHPGPDALPAGTLKNLPELTRRVEALVAQGRSRELSEWIGADRAVAALGRYLATLNPADIGRFRTPSLRNVADTAPYFHDGHARSLADAVDAELYGRADARYPIVLTGDERNDLVAFLRALTTSEVPGDRYAVSK